MVPRPPDDDDPTSEKEIPPFDGTQTDQLDDTYRLDDTARLRSVATSESANGAVGWATPLVPASGDATDTIAQLTTPENPALELKDELPATPEPAGKTRHNPESGAGGGT